LDACERDSNAIHSNTRSAIKYNSRKAIPRALPQPNRLGGRNPRSGPVTPFPAPTPIGRFGSDLADLPAQHRQLMAKNQDLHLFVDIGTEPRDHELGEPGDRLVQE
jgi:hypothetical protein